MQPSLGKMSAYTILDWQDRAASSIEQTVAAFLEIGEAIATRWIQTAKGVLLLQMVPGDSASGAIYILDRRRDQLEIVPVLPSGFQKILSRCLPREQQNPAAGKNRLELYSQSMPLNFGIMTSEIRKSGQCASAARNASIGSVNAVADESKIILRVEAIAGSSSTTKILGLWFVGIHRPPEPESSSNRRHFA